MEDSPPSLLIQPNWGSKQMLQVLISITYWSGKGMKEFAPSCGNWVMKWSLQMLKDVEEWWPPQNLSLPVTMEMRPFFIDSEIVVLVLRFGIASESENWDIFSQIIIVVIGWNQISIRKKKGMKNLTGIYYLVSPLILFGKIETTLSLLWNLTQPKRLYSELSIKLRRLLTVSNVIRLFILSSSFLQWICEICGPLQLRDFGI